MNGIILQLLVIVKKIKNNNKKLQYIYILIKKQLF